MDVDDKKAEETPVPATNGDAPAETNGDAPKTETVEADAEKKVEETPVQEADAPADAPAEEAKADEDMAVPATSETAA